MLAVFCWAHDPDLLMVSNEPENIRQPGVLLSNEIQNNEITRIVSYHKNVSSGNIEISVILENSTDRDAAVKIFKGEGGPDNDGLFAGHAALRKYYQKWLKQDQEEVIVPSRSAITVSRQVLKPQQIASAVLQIALLTSGKLKVSLTADDENSKGRTHLFQVNREDNAQRIGGLFSTPQMDYVHTIDVDQETSWYYRVGDEPFIVDYLTKRSLKGNYGLQYQYKIKLKNSGKETKYVDCFFTANGGAARGVLVIDGKLLETAVVRPYGEDSVYYLRRWVIPSSAEIDTEIFTMPQAGSNYPVTLVFKVR